MASVFYILDDNGEVLRTMPSADIEALNCIKDEMNNIYLEGEVSFSGDGDYNYLRNLKVYNYKIQVPVEYEGRTGVMSLSGEWHYNRKTCKLKVTGNSSYDTFKTILNKEYNTSTNTSKTFWQFESFLDYKWSSSEIVDDVYPDYSHTGNTDPDAWDNSTNYIAANIEPDGSGGFYYYGNPISFVSHSGKRWACQITNTNSEPSAINTDWVDITFSTVLEYSQERALFEFDGSTYDEENKYWYKASTTTSTFESNCFVLNIKDMLLDILEDNGFVLNTNWIKYATDYNSDYDTLMRIANTETVEKIKLEEIISYIEQAFNLHHYVIEGELIFYHWTEINLPWTSSLPREHDLTNYDIYDWKREENTEVKRHKLSFTESGLDTHENSIIEYDNNYEKEADIVPEFDVDFVYAMNEGDVNCLVTLDSSGGIKYDSVNDVFNPYFIPKDLHEHFYFFGREYNSGEFDGNLVSLTEEFNESTDRELDNTYNIDSWDMLRLVKINNLVGKEDGNFAKLDKITYSFYKRNFTLNMRTKV